MYTMTSIRISIHRQLLRTISVFGLFLFVLSMPVAAISDADRRSLGELTGIRGYTNNIVYVGYRDSTLGERPISKNNLLSLQHHSRWERARLYTAVNIRDTELGSYYIYRIIPRYSVRDYLPTQLTGSWLRDVAVFGSYDRLSSASTGPGRYEVKQLGVRADFRLPFDILGQLHLSYYDQRYRKGSSDQMILSLRKHMTAFGMNWSLSNLTIMRSPEGRNSSRLFSHLQLQGDIGSLWNYPNRVFVGAAYRYHRNHAGTSGFNLDNSRIYLRWQIASFGESSLRKPFIPLIER